MKEVTITIKTTYSAQCRAIDEHSITAYADDRFPGLAIHAPWDFFTDTWRVTHVPSGLAVAILPTRAAATAALELIGKLQNWNRPQAEVAAHGEPGEARWLKVAVAAAVEQVNRERAAALAQAVEMGTIKAVALEAALGDFRCNKMGRDMAQPFPRHTWRLDNPRPQAARGRRRSCRRRAPGRRPLCRRQRLQPQWQLPPGRLGTAHMEATFRPLADLPRNLPDKALSRGAYDANRRAARKSAPLP